MKYKMINWRIPDRLGLIGFKRDNLVTVLEFITDVGPEWEQFKLGLSQGGKSVVVDMIQDGNRLYATLTAEMLAFRGVAALQISGSYGEVVRHSNQAVVFVSDSIDGLADYPALINARISVKTCVGAEVVCTDGKTMLFGVGSTMFYVPNTGLWTVTATLGGESASQTVPVTEVSRYYTDVMITSGIAVTALSTKTVYRVGEAFDATGLVVTATYADGTTVDVTKDCTITPAAMEASTTGVTIAYTKAGVVTTTIQPVTIYLLSAITVTCAPSKTEYEAGETFDARGMVVMATYTDGETKIVTDWTHRPAGVLAPSHSEITISYTQDGITKETTQAITVIARCFTVCFYNESVLLQTVSDVASGGSASYIGSTPVKGDVDNPEAYLFLGWNPLPTNITRDTNCYAQFEIPFEVAEITDSWAQIIAAVDDGTYRQKYSKGNYKPMDLGTEGVINMQIATFDEDVLADGSGNAPITWIGMELLKNKRIMNPLIDYNDDDSYKIGTGTAGGWEHSTMRGFMKETMLPLIPEEVRGRIKPVTKSSSSYSTQGKSEQTATADEAWIPSYYEVFGGGGFEKTGPTYSTLFSDAKGRTKKIVDTTNGIHWWVRTAHSIEGVFRCVTSTGSSLYYDGDSYGKFGVALGFCIG